jgi:hypothetical protein
MNRFRSALALLVLLGALTGCMEVTTAPQQDEEECTPTIGGGGRCEASGG